MIVGVIIFFLSIMFSTILYLQSNRSGLNPEISLLVIPGVIISCYFGLKYCKIQERSIILKYPTCNKNSYIAWKKGTCIIKNPEKIVVIEGVGMGAFWSSVDWWDKVAA